MPRTKVEQRLIISAWALVPFLAACVFMAIILYSSRKGRSLTAHGGIDALMWVGAAVIFFGSTFGIMFAPLPGVDAAEVKELKSGGKSA